MRLLAARWTIGASHNHRVGKSCHSSLILKLGFNLKRRFLWPIFEFEFGSNLQLPVVMRNDIVCLNAAVLPWQIWKCVARNTKWLLVVHPDYSYQYYEKCVLKCSSIAVTNLKLCGEKYEMTPGRKSMCWIGRNPFGQIGGARVDKLVGQLNQL